MTRILLVFLALLALVSALPEGRRVWRRLFQQSGFSNETDAPLSIHVLDVGKADAILIRCEGHAALIDAGTYLNGETVVDYMARSNFPPLDYAIASHPDKDHIGGMGQVLLEAGAGLFLRSKYHEEEYEGLEEVLEEKAIPQRILSPGDTLQLGGAVLEVLGPVKEYEETNDSSLVLRLSYQGFTALFCGDVEEGAEKDLIKSGANLKADLLKVPHHGSDTSSTKRFLKAVQPSYAVISVGPDNNDLPKEEALIRLEETGAEVYRTDTDGTVVFTYDGEEISVITEHAGKGAP